VVIDISGRRRHLLKRIKLDGNALG